MIEAKFAVKPQYQKTGEWLFHRDGLKQVRKLKDLVEEGLRLVLETPRGKRKSPSLAELMERARGVVDSGIPDLASNPEHLAGLGRDARRHR